MSGWLRDLTREGVEANPGPVHCRGKKSDGAPCNCPIKFSSVLTDPEYDIVNRKCGCGHARTDHDDAEVSFGSGAAVVSPASLVAQLQRDLVPPTAVDEPSLSAAVDLRRRAGRRSLARHTSALPASGIPAADFGAYLKFVNRGEECAALVAHLQEVYLAFLHRADTPIAERGGGGDYLKALQVVYSAGAPGVGKTTWARMALDHAPLGCASDERFAAVLERCTQCGWRYRICFGEDMLEADELAAPDLSLAARLLWQHVKYELCRSSTVRSYVSFWRYLRAHSLLLSVADVLEHICADVPARERMLLVNLDEVNVLFPDSVVGTAVGPPSPEAVYLQRLLRHMLQLQIDGVGFVMPVLTATKALCVREVIRLSGCSLREIPLPLLAAPYVDELVRDLLTRARQASRTVAPPGSIASASEALAALQVEEQSSELPLPPLLCNLLELMAGHPRFLEKLLFRLGRPDGAAEEWSASTFVAHMRQLQSPAPPASAVLESWLSAVAEDILTRYSAFKQYIVRPAFVSIAPQLLGYTLFQWSINREREFSEREYRCSVQQLEEDGVVFLTPKPAPLPAAASACRHLHGSPPDVELRLVMPFLWLHVLYVRHADHYASSVVQLPLVKTLTCQLTPAQNEELTLSVLALKCFCLAKRGDAFISCRQLLGAPAGAGPDVQLRLPIPSATQWAPIKLKHQVTAKTWEAWYAQHRGPPAGAGASTSSHSRRRDARGASRSSAAAAMGASAAAASPPRAHFFLNAEKAPFWDSCVLTEPPLFVQDKQSLVARERAVQGKPPSNTQWADVQAEMDKCKVGELAAAPLFLFCSDDMVVQRPAELPERVAIIDRGAHAAFFGPVLASRRAMCLSELGAAAATD